MPKTKRSHYWCNLHLSEAFGFSNDASPELHCAQTRPRRRSSVWPFRGWDLAGPPSRKTLVNKVSGLFSFPPFETIPAAEREAPARRKVDILYAGRAKVVVTRIHAWKDGTVERRPLFAAC